MGNGDFKILLQALLDDSSLTDIEKKLAKKKINVGLDLDFANSIKESEKQIEELSKRFKTMFNFKTDTEAMSFTKKYLSEANKLISQNEQKIKQAEKNEQAEIRKTVAEINKKNQAREKANAQNTKVRTSNANSILTEEIQSLNKIADLRAKIVSNSSNGNTSQVSVLKEELVLEQSHYDRLRSESSLYADIISNEERRKALKDASLQSELKVQQAQAKATDTATLQAEKAETAELEKQATLIAKIKSYQSGTAKGTSLETDYLSVEKSYQSYEKLGVATDKLKADFAELKVAKNALDTSSDANLISNSERWNTALATVNNTLKQTKLSMQSIPASANEISGAIARITNYMAKNTAMDKAAKTQMQGFITTLQSGNVSKEWIAQMNADLATTDARLRSVGKVGYSAFDKLKNAWSKYGGWGIATGSIMAVLSSIRQATSDLIDMNSILTEISKTNDTISKQGLADLEKSSFGTASKYGQKATDYLTGVQEMNRSGYYGEQGNQMAELSTLAQSAGDMDADVANNYLLATNAAYKYAGSAEKLNAVLDGQNVITNRNSVDMETMASATEKAGSTASMTGVKIEQLSAMIGTIEASTKETGEQVGTGIKSLLINLQNTGSDKIVNTLDEAGASMTELKNGVEQMRDPIDILKDLQKTFNSLDASDPLKSKILTNIGQKYHANELSALLSNWDQYEKMIQDYSEGSGSAAEEADKSAHNIEGSMNRLGNTWDSTVLNFENSDGIITTVDALNGLLTVIDKITGSLGGFSSIATILSGVAGANGLGFVNYDENGNVTTLLDKFKNNLPKITDDFRDFASSIENVTQKDISNGWVKYAKSINNTDNELLKFLGDADSGKRDIKDIDSYMQSASTATSAFGATLKSVAASMAIMLAISLVIKGVTTAWDKFDTTVEESKENLTNTQSVISDLKSQISELNSIPANELTQGQKDKLENLQQQLAAEEQLEVIEKRRVAREMIGNGNIGDYFDKDSYAYASQDIYEQIREATQKTTGFTGQNNKSNKKYNDILSEIEQTKKQNASGAYDEAIQRMEEQLSDVAKDKENKVQKLEGVQGELISTKASIQDWMNKINSSINDGSLVGVDLDKARAELEVLKGYSEHVDNQMEKINNSLYAGTGTDWKSQLASKTQYSLKNLRDDGFSDSDLSVLATVDFDKNATLEELHELIDNAQRDADGKIIEIKTDLEAEDTSPSPVSSITDAMAYKTQPGNLDDDGNQIYNSTLGDDIDNYQSKIKDINTALKGLDKGTVSITDMATKFGVAGNSVEECKQNLRDLAQSELDDVYAEIDEIINDPDTESKTADILKTIRNEIGATYDQVNNLSSISLTGNVLSDIQDLSSDLSKLDSIYADILDGDSFDWSSILNNDEFEAAFSGLGSSYQNFIDTVTNSPNDISACQSAFDQLSSSYLYQSGVLDELSDDTAQSAINMLTEMGYANANSMVMNALAANKEYAAATGNNLVDATYEEIVQLAQEGSTTDQTRQYLIEYIQAKAAASGVTLQTSGDINNLNDLIDALQSANILMGTFNNPKSDVKLQESFSGTGVSTDGGANDNTGTKKQQLYTPTFSPAKFTGGDASNKVREQQAKDAKDSAKEAEDAAKKAAEEAEKAITDAISRIKGAIDELGNEADDTYASWSSRNKALADEMGMIPAEIAEQQELQKFYESQGDLTQAQEAANAIKDLQRDLKKLADQKLDNIKTFYEDIIKLTDSLKDLKQSVMDIKDAQGVLSNEYDYGELISHSKSEQENYTKELNELQGQLQDNIDNGYIEEGSEAWYKWQVELNSVKKEINECQKAQVEWNESIAQVPIEGLELYSTLVKNATARIEAFNSSLDARGLTKGINNISEEMMALNETISMSQCELTNYTNYIKNHLSDSINGWASLTEEQINQVFDYINTDNALGLHDYMGSLGIDDTKLKSFYEYAEKLSDVKVDLQEAATSQTELVKEAQKLDVTGAEYYKQMMERYSDIVNAQEDTLGTKNSDYTEKFYQNQIGALAKTISASNNLLYNYRQNIEKGLTDPINGWADFTEDQVDEVFKYIDSGDTDSLFSMLNENGLNPSSSEELFGYISDITSAEGDITTAKQEQLQIEEQISNLKIECLTNEDSLVSGIIEKYQSIIDLKNSSGRTVTATDYTNLLNNSYEKQDTLNNKHHLLTKKLSGVDEGSEQYYDILGQLNDIENTQLQIDKNQAEWNQKISEIPLNKLKDANERISTVGNRLQDVIDLKEATGRHASTYDYSQLINNSKQDVSNLQQQNSLLNSMISNVEYGSERYNELKSQIESNEDSIRDAEKSQVEWNKAILQLDITKIENMQVLVDKAKSSLDSLISLIEKHGSTVSDGLLSKEINQSAKAIENDKKLISGYYDYIKKGFSDSVNGWANLANDQINKIIGYVKNGDNDGLNSYLGSLNLDPAILTEFYDYINKISDAENDMWSQAVTQEEYLDEMIQNRIDSLSDEKDKLDKINQAKQKQIELEKLQQKLQEAKDNRTSLIYHEGSGFVYEADQTDIKEAQDSLDDWYYDDMLDKIDDLIDTLNDWKDDYNLYNDDGTLKSNWNSILSSVGTNISSAVTNALKGLGLKMDNAGTITVVQSNAKGTLKAKEGWSNINELGNEMILHTNNGDLTKLSYGDSVIPSDLSARLMDMAIDPSSYALSNMNIKIPKLPDFSVRESAPVYQINCDKFEFPGISDGSDAQKFMNQLSNLSTKAVQFANKK